MERSMARSYLSGGRPSRRYHRAHGLGNDYLVLDEGFGLPMTDARARLLCDRHRGVGSDGVLLATRPQKGADAAVRIFNPDGSEAEKSGNGVRIFAAWCYARRRFDRKKPIVIETLGGRVRARLQKRLAEGVLLTVEMGRASFLMRDLPMLAPDGRPAAADATWVGRPLGIGERSIAATCLSVGNPHAVLVGAPCDEKNLAELGPLVENHAQFPHRVNMQLCEVLDRRRVRALVWERGAGPTLASGSSACAVAAAGVESGRLDADVELEVVMPGGRLWVRVGSDRTLLQTGPVEEIADGEIADDLWRALSGPRPARAARGGKRAPRAARRG
jgi:diaminopimelate epimerase